MAFFAIRFDFRNPSHAGTSMAERYAAALDMCEWADRLGFVQVILSEHHGSDDGYLPSPLPMAAAIAARTRNMRINVAAFVSAFHDPIRLAEDIAVVDNLSQGRLDLVLAQGYVTSEFEMFGVPLDQRVAKTKKLVEVLRGAWTGEEFDYEDRRGRVTPAPFQPGGPKITLGGSTETAARRAARLGDGYMPSEPALWEPYREECVKIGKPDPGPYLGGDTSFFHLAEDVEAGWDAIAPFALHEVNAYGSWMDAAAIDQGGYKPAADADALRATGQYRVLTPGDFLEEVQGKGPFGFALFHPLMGGIPPELAWSSLRLFEEQVLPKLG